MAHDILNCPYITSAMFTQPAGLYINFLTLLAQQAYSGIQQAYTGNRHTQATGIQQAAIQHMLTHSAYSILPYSDNTYTVIT